MVNKVSTSLRWTVVFVVLLLFTFYSLTAYSIISGDDNIYAENIKKDKDLSRGHHFIAFDEDKKEDRHRYEKQKLICIIDQSQFDSLKDRYAVKVKDISTGDNDVKVAVVKKNRHVNKHDIYDALGIDDRSCKLIQQNRSFFIFLLPGVS